MIMHPSHTMCHEPAIDDLRLHCQCALVHQMERTRSCRRTGWPCGWAMQENKQGRGEKRWVIVYSWIGTSHIMCTVCGVWRGACGVCGVWGPEIKTNQKYTHMACPTVDSDGQ